MSGNKRSINIRGHRTSVSVEPEFWETLTDIASADEQSVAAIVAAIDADRGESGLSSAIRLYVLARLRERPIVRSRQDETG